MVTEQPRVFIQHCPVGVLGSGWLGRCCRWRGCWHRGGCHVCLHWCRRLLCQHHAAGRVCFLGTGYLVWCHHAGNDKLSKEFGRGVDELPCPHSSLHVFCLSRLWCVQTLHLADTAMGLSDMLWIYTIFVVSITLSFPRMYTRCSFHRLFGFC